MKAWQLFFEMQAAAAVDKYRINTTMTVVCGAGAKRKRRPLGVADQVAASHKQQVLLLST